MNYWLIKSEPEVFSWDQLEEAGTCMWEGVRNFQARNYLRNTKLGDVAFFYYSGKNPCIAGLVEVCKEYYPDPTANDGEWSAIDVKPIRKLKRCISLQEVKKNSALQSMYLVRNSRLSVQPVTSEQYRIIMALETV